MHNTCTYIGIGLSRLCSNVPPIMLLSLPKNFSKISPIMLLNVAYYAAQFITSRDAQRKARYSDCARPSVCLFVCLSV